jgi:hypothetical protein
VELSVEWNLYKFFTARILTSFDCLFMADTASASSLSVNFRLFPVFSFGPYPASLPPAFSFRLFPAVSVYIRAKGVE